MSSSSEYSDGGSAGLPWWVRYLDFFPSGHNGIPFFCKHRYCPLDHRNKLTNDNDYVRLIGPVGLQYFDAKRKIYFGLASLFTLFAMVITIWGCSALSTDRSVVQRTYWYGGTGVNSTMPDGTDQEFSFYVGLRSLEYVNCGFVPGYEGYPASCDRQSYKFFSESCEDGPVAAACSACANVAFEMWLTAFMACVSLLLSLLGAQTRMHTYADVPAQKMLGMFAETWNIVTLTYALLTFHGQCRQQLGQAFNASGLSTSMWSGPGLYCYAVCAASAMVRASVHWLTPLPGQGQPRGPFGWCAVAEGLLLASGGEEEPLPPSLRMSELAGSSTEEATASEA